MCDFKVVTYKKNRKRKSTRIEDITLKDFNPLSCSQIGIPPERIVKRIKSAKEDIEKSTFYKNFIQQLNQENCIEYQTDIVSYGIGQFSQCNNSRYQFAFLLALRDYYNARVFVYDPMFSSDELTIVNEFGCLVIETNEEGKRLAIHKTLFFLPHCPQQLINNLLWKNWGEHLGKCIIIGNSFDLIIETHPNRYVKENLLYIFHASSIVKEIVIENSFEYLDIFNDLSIHLFLEENLKNLPSSILNLNIEPTYKKDDVGLITYNLQSNLNIS